MTMLTIVVTLYGKLFIVFSFLFLLNELLIRASAKIHIIIVNIILKCSITFKTRFNQLMVSSFFLKL